MSNESAGYIDFTISRIEDNGKIVLATVLALILTIGILTNVFIMVYTFCHPKSIKSSSIIFLLGSSFANVIQLVSLIPVQITVISAEEWVFGSTTEEKELACAINAYFTGLSFRTASYSLATISVDRFVFLVKPLVHKRYFKPVPSAVALVVIMLLLAIHRVILLAFGRAVFNQNALICHSQSPYIYIALINSIITVAPVITIAVTTVWTFISTRRFIRNDHQQRVDAIGTQEEAVEIENGLYTRRIKNLFGIFSLLLISQIISNLPLAIIIAGSAGGYNDKLPSWYVYCAILLLNFGCISNPAIQCYFRKDLTDAIKNVYSKLSCFSSSR